MRPRVPREGVYNPPGLQTREEMFRYRTVASIVTLDKAYRTQQIGIGTTPILVIETFRPMAYLVANPSAAQTTLATSPVIEESIFPLQSRAPGTFFAPTSAIDVSNYEEGHLYLRITAVGAGGRVTIGTTEEDLGGNVYTTQVPSNLSKKAAPGTFYAYLGSLGVARRFGLAARVETANVTFSVDFVAKCPCTTSSTISEPNIFLGNQDVTVASGFALTPAERIILTMAENTRLFAISSQATILHILEMGI